jgi:hypothetical protein
VRGFALAQNKPKAHGKERRNVSATHGGRERCAGILGVVRRIRGRMSEDNVASLLRGPGASRRRRRVPPSPPREDFLTLILSGRNKPARVASPAKFRAHTTALCFHQHSWFVRTIC